MTRAELRERARTGFTFKLVGKRGSKEMSVSRDYFADFLQALEGESDDRNA